MLQSALRIREQIEQVGVLDQLMSMTAEEMYALEGVSPASALFQPPPNLVVSACDCVSVCE